MGLFDVFRRVRTKTGPASSPPPPTAAPDPYAILQAPLLAFSEIDIFTLADACQGVQIFGAVGSGKTSGSGQALALAYLEAGFGGLVLCAKADEAELWKNYCALAGRTADLMIVRSEGDLCFNFLDYQLAGDGRNQIENIVQLFLRVLETGGRKRQGGGGDPYWETALAELLRNSVALLVLAGERVGLEEISGLIASAARSLEQAASPEWREDSVCGMLLTLAAARAEDDSSLVHDHQQTRRYWLQGFPGLAEKTRSIVESSFTGLADEFLRGAMRRLFCGETTFRPEDSFAGKILVLDLPIKTQHDVGRKAQVLLKLCWQRAAERRTASENPLPVFLWADECQLFLGPSDQEFLSTARSARVCTVFLTQNLPNYIAAFGGDRHAVASILGNLVTTIFHANGDAETNEWASRTIASSWQNKMSISGGTTSQ